MAGYHLPEHHAQRIQVRADIHANAGELLRTSELRCTRKSSGTEIAASAGASGSPLLELQFRSGPKQPGFWPVSDVTAGGQRHHHIQSWKEMRKSHSITSWRSTCHKSQQKRKNAIFGHSLRFKYRARDDNAIIGNTPSRRSIDLASSPTRIASSAKC